MDGRQKTGLKSNRFFVFTNISVFSLPTPPGRGTILCVSASACVCVYPFAG